MTNPTLRQPLLSHGPIYNGMVLASYAELAYTEDPLPLHHSWDFVERFGHKNASGFIAAIHPAHERPKIVIAIRGTDEPGDMIEDMKSQAVKLATSRIGVHKGFSDHTQKVTKALEPWRHILSSDAEVWIAGHSLGGAAAVLLPLHMNLPADTQAFTYGAPPAIAMGFGGQYVREVTRFAHIGDVIPKVYRRDFEHVARPFWIRGHGKVSGSLSVLHRWKVMLEKAGRVVFTGPWSTTLHYHSMKRYRSSLEAVG